MPYTSKEPNNNDKKKNGNDNNSFINDDNNLNNNEKSKINYHGIKGIYTQHDTYKPYTIFDSDNAKLSTIPVSSTTGSLSSIITTSVASSEPDPGSDRGGDYGDETLTTHSGHIIKQEEWWKTLYQVSIPFFIAGIGTIGAGVILGTVEKWDVFQNVRPLIILVPALLGLKGNLDMCLSSRLSTQANLGNMTTRSETIRMIVGNISLVQVQAIVAAFIVALFAIAVGAATSSGDIRFDHAMLLIASSMFTATSTCFVLDFVLVAVILVAHKLNMNPDNLATPLAASIGDVVSLSMLSLISHYLYIILDTHYWVTFIVVAVYLIMLPFWVFCVLRNKYTRPVLKSGWTPVISALIISGLGGLVLDQALDVFNGFATFSPIINGIGGNLVSVQASKMSTMLHQSSELGVLPPRAKIFEYPWKALFRGVPYAKTARILILMSIPGQVVFIFTADVIYLNKSTIGGIFVFSYLLVSTVQVMCLLYIAHIIIHFMWKRKIDPDNSAIPYLTALGDLFGSCFLALAFLLMTSMHFIYDPDSTETTDDLLSTTASSFNIGG